MDYREIVIEDLTREVETLKADLRELDVWRTLAQEALIALETANQQRARLTATVRRFMAITNGTGGNESAYVPSHPPPRPLSEFPTDTAPFVSVHEIRWR